MTTTQSPRRSSAALALLAACLGGCAAVPDAPEPPAMEVLQRVTAFSLAQPDGELPGGWRPWRLSRLKKLTSYQLVDYNGTVVVKAMSASSASGLMHPLDLDPREFPFLQWRWKVPQLIAGADNARRSAEDAPVRVVLSFAGDTSALSLEDRAFYDRIRALTGYDLPYATLMYIWENRAPAGTIIPNPHTARIQMVVAESGAARTGSWKLEMQNVYEDYRRAFGEEPGRIQAIAIMTDTDNTGSAVEAYYGDIAFLKPEEAARVTFAPGRRPASR
jgi:hypothetical protein